jgi:hypothetical protein
VGKGRAKKSVITGETGMSASPKLTVAIGKPKDHRRYDSGSVAIGKPTGTKKAAIPTTAVASRKGIKRTRNPEDDRNYELYSIPTVSVASRKIVFRILETVAPSKDSTYDVGTDTP